MYKLFSLQTLYLKQGTVHLHALYLVSEVQCVQMVPTSGKILDCSTWSVFIPLLVLQVNYGGLHIQTFIHYPPSLLVYLRTSAFTLYMKCVKSGQILHGEPSSGFQKINMLLFIYLFIFSACIVSNYKHCNTDS